MKKNITRLLIWIINFLMLYTVLRFLCKSNLEIQILNCVIDTWTFLLELKCEYTKKVSMIKSQTVQTRNWRGNLLSLFLSFLLCSLCLCCSVCVCVCVCVCWCVSVCECVCFFFCVLTELNSFSQHIYDYLHLFQT